ncbi:ice-binding family protein [Glutamicibacter sp. HZAU]|uniref:ice-binding family protein n=1 Tax=Glutamicibacter sp. HZAU TaxID=2049891 RepID=UPI000FFBBAB8|nr:ice-binding family protein [Glutamicibacter sp. HZAU]RWZ79894.1 DUF3494 domain-containing protein [Glutamicibacter sp. HZAU]
MEPHISPGDVAVASPWDESDPVPMGGVVQYRSPAAAEPDGIERLRLHRIVEANDDGTFVTAGDANQDVDSSSLTRSQIIGQARILIPMIGLPGFWLNTGNFGPLILWGLVTLAALILAFRGPGRRPNIEDDSDGDADLPEEEVAEERVGVAEILSPRRFDRRTALTLVGLAAAGSIFGPQIPASTAAFSTSTRTKASWSVAKLPELTLGRAATYLLMAHESIQHSPALGIGTTISGSVATSPGTKIEGFWPWDISGSTDRNTTGARNAKTDLLALYAALNKYPATATRDPVLSGTIKPGVYTSSTGRFTINGTVTLDGQGDPSARFIFRASTITSASGSTIALTRGTKAANVYWRSTGDITLGSSSTNRGIYLANADGVMQSRAELAGHLYSCTGSLTIIRSTVQSA